MARNRAASRIPAAPAEPLDALAAVERSIEAAWEAERAQHPDEDDAATARRIADDPSQHPWRLVDAALMRLRCDACGEALGAGAVGCAPCDLAHGFRFAAREPDRAGVAPGNEHAIRVSAAIQRLPHRYPAWAVAGNRLRLPLFLAGDMPTRREQELMVAARRRGAAAVEQGAATFSEMAARAAASARRR